jgi:hypothetical protein
MEALTLYNALLAIGKWQEECPCTCTQCLELREFYSKAKDEFEVK